MLNGTEFLIAVGFVLAFLVMSTIDVALTNVNKVVVRRIADRPKAKAANALVAMLDTRTEILTSIHIIIQLFLVSGAVFVFTVFERRQIPYSVAVLGTVVAMMFVILV